jgi:hypothetical protein
MNTVDLLIQRERVREVVTRLFVHTDEKDWPRARLCFADEVLFDMESVTGETPQRVSAESIVASWEKGQAPIEAVHHQIGNFLIEIAETEAQVLCHGVALHHRSNPSRQNTRVFVGTYEFRLRRPEVSWKIDEFHFYLKFIDGNLDLEAS